MYSVVGRSVDRGRCGNMVAIVLEVYDVITTYRSWDIQHGERYNYRGGVFGVSYACAVRHLCEGSVIKLSTYLRVAPKGLGAIE